MPFATNDDVRLFWRLEGAAERPVLLLLNALGADLSLWDRVAPRLLLHFRLLRMDARGQGASDVPAGDYRLQDLATDALAVMDAAAIRQATVCGIGFGGCIALTLALRAPARIAAIVCACGTAQVEKDEWAESVRRIRSAGMTAAVDPLTARFFSETFVHSHPEVVESLRTTLRLTDPAGFAGCAAAMRDMALLEQLPGITQPVLLLSGTRDVATPFEPHGAQLLAALPDARHVSLDAAHLACLEAPEPFAAALSEFVRSLEPNSATRGVMHLDEAARALYEAGLTIRREVLGNAWVDRALASRTGFNRDFQEMITRSAWQEIWSRPGLDHRTRRLLVLAMTIAQGRWEEFRLHVRAGLAAAGFSETELREVLMQSAVYVGVPAANTAFAQAAEVMRELQTPDASRAR